MLFDVIKKEFFEELNGIQTKLKITQYRKSFHGTYDFNFLHMNSEVHISTLAYIDLNDFLEEELLKSSDEFVKNLLDEAINISKDIIKSITKDVIVHNNEVNRMLLNYYLVDSIHQEIKNHLMNNYPELII